MWSYGFHNSVNGDRVYNADQMSGIFEGLITAGVYESVGNKLAVQPNSGMTIQIATGRGWFNNRWVNNDSPYLINLEASDVTLNRYAAICVKGDNSTGVRATQPYVKYSDYATTPVKPAMTRTNDIKEYCLAYVYIGHGVTSISAADIEDTRQDSNLCGWVTGLIDQITPDTLYTQFTAQFNEWFSGLVDIIDEDVETTLVNALPKSLTVIIPTTAWTGSGSSYTANVTVTGMNATKSVVISPNSDTVNDYSSNGLKATDQSTNSITFTATAKPTVDIKVDILHMGQ